MVPRDGNLQTLWGTVLRRTPVVPTACERWSTPDGDVIDLERLPAREAPCVVVLHGLEGSTRVPYVRGLLQEVYRRGWNGVAINFRSCGPSRPRNARTYHSGFTEDLALVLERLSVEGMSTIGLVGFSLGGNVVLKFLAESAEAAPVAAAVGVSVPFDLAACVATLDGPGLWARLFRGGLLRRLRAKALATELRFPGCIDPAHARNVRSIREFDEHVTARLFGFAGAEDYWARCSSGPRVGAIRKPTIMLAAVDDPLVPPASIPTGDIAANPALQLILLPSGGHLGFVTGTAWAPRFAAERIAVDFLAERFEKLRGSYS
jgi:predicted alpha/beta-fold hydrolase